MSSFASRLRKPAPVIARRMQSSRQQARGCGQSVARPAPQAKAPAEPLFGHDFSRLRLHAVAPREDTTPEKKHEPDGGGECALHQAGAPHESLNARARGAGLALPWETAPVHGDPTPIGAGANSIICHGGDLIVQNNNSGPDRDCTQQHESSHIADWKGRYGSNLCHGVADGSLPLGGPGYAEFLRTSECRAYGIGKACRVALLAAAPDADKPAIQAGINRDNAQIASLHCA